MDYRKGLTVVAKVLLVGNAVLLVGAYFALPVHEQMHPRPNGLAEIVGFELLTAVDVVAAALLLKQWIRTGIACFAVTSTIWCGYSIFLQLQADQSVAWIWTPLIAYWDLALLTFLVWRDPARA